MKIIHNAERLNRLVNEKYASHHDFALAIDMSDQELEYKLSNPGQFTLDETEKACGLLARRKTAISYLFCDYTIVEDETEERLNATKI